MTENVNVAPVAANDQQANSAKLAHILNGIFPLVGGLILWLTSKDQGAFADDQGKEATNFGILLVAGQIAANIVMAIGTFITLGFGALILWILPLGVWVWGLIQGIKVGNIAATGQVARYSWNPLRLIK